MVTEPGNLLPLNYQAPKHGPFWPANPISWLGGLGALVGLIMPPMLLLWDRWAENVTRVPRLWYQQELLLPSTCMVLIIASMITCFRYRWRFSVGLLIGAAIAVGLLIFNLVMQASYRRGILFYG